LLQILALLSNRDQSEINADWEGKSSYGDFKEVVADVVSDFLTGFQSRLAGVEQAALETKLQSSEKQMRAMADETLLRVQQAVGLREA
jgi:tryptophanyl-tRNA synthetase